MSHMNSTFVDTQCSQPEAVLSLRDILGQLDQYRSRPVKGFDVLRDYTDYCVDPRVAAVFIECAVAADRVDLAEMVLPMAQDKTGIFGAMIQMAKGNPKQALDALNTIPDDPRHQVYAYGLRIQANVMIRQYDAASKAVFDWATAMPLSPQPFRTMGNALAKRNDPRAERWFERAVNVSGGGSGAVLDMAAFLIKQGRKTEAGGRLDSLEYVLGRNKRRKMRLQRELA